MSESRPQPTEGFAYSGEAPTSPGAKELVSTDIGVLGIRVLNPGDTTELEMLDGTDTFCFVKRGGIRVLGADGSVISEGAQNDSVVIPAGTTFRLEALGGDHETVEILQFYASNDDLPASFQPFS